MEERFYWLAFSVFPGVGPLRFKKLLQVFGSAKKAWEATSLDLKRAGLGEARLKKFEEFRAKFSFPFYQRRLLDQGVSLVTFVDKEYPKLLSQIKNPPILLYVRGKLKDKDQSIAIVGTRKITQYGREVTELITSELVQSGFTIVSGLALGVDAVAHKTAVEQGGKTIAVLGCGVDCCTPSENSSLYHEIIKTGGAIVSELPLGHPPTKGSFPSRNRIIAGLSLGVLVTEGAEDSGALITAEYGLKFGRKVFAVPGPITSSLSKGPYKLIQKGAKLVTKAEDILKEFKIHPAQRDKITTQSFDFAQDKNSKFGTTEEEERILEILGVEPLNFDEIVKRSKMGSSKVGSLLSMMEIRGMIKSSGSGTFSIAR